MSADVPLNPGPGIWNVAINGIQDVSPFIPLIGTSHCERLVTSALECGLLYAAATPMSIFGSLGILKAGFITLWSSIDTHLFWGPTSLKDAGFLPCGNGTLLLHVAQSKKNLYVAEEKLRCILSKKRIRSVKINVLSKDLVMWNLRLFAFAVLLSSLGLLPYILPIRDGLPGETFGSTWIYPLFRTIGCDIIAVTIQLLYQLRILEETYCRIKFMAIDSYLKDHGKSVPSFWDSNQRSRHTLHLLRRELAGSSASSENNSAGTTILRVQDADQGVSRWRQSLGREREEMEKLLRQGLGTMSSFAFPSFRPPPQIPQGSLSHTSEPSASSAPIFEGTIVRDRSPPVLPPIGLSPSADSNAAEKGEACTGTVSSAAINSPLYPPTSMTGPCLSFNPAQSRLLNWFTCGFTTALLWVTQLGLAIGISLTVVGYIGCFSLIQAGDRARWRGPIYWIALEGGLSLARMVLWGCNPDWDDAKSPIALEKVPCDDAPDAGAGQKKSSYGIGWKLDSPTADQMHALIIGVNKCNSDVLGDLTQCVEDGKRVAGYLKDTLLVPSSQITELYDEEATKERVSGELKALAHRGTVAHDAPIVIYFAGHSFVSAGDQTTYLVSYRRDDQRQGMLENTSLSYFDIVGLLEHIGREKTDAITLILDCCYASTMGKNKKFDGPDSPSSPSQLSSTATAPGLQDAMDALLADDTLARSGRRGTACSKAGLILNAQNQKILVGHSSHILLAGSNERAMEDPDMGGRFTRHLLEVLKKPETLKTKTYKEVVGEINDLSQERFKFRQQATCTTIYKDRFLFNGLFTRKINEDSTAPVITVEYSDY